jgi:hypothetical protein
MSKSYRLYYAEQDLLLPPSLREWLRENHLVYFVSDVVDNLNLTALHAMYGDEQRRQPPYDPRMMTNMLVYGYCVGVFSFAAPRAAVGSGHTINAYIATGKQKHDRQPCSRGPLAAMRRGSTA